MVKVDSFLNNMQPFVVLSRCYETNIDRLLQEVQIYYGFSNDTMEHIKKCGFPLQ